MVHPLFGCHRCGHQRNEDILQRWRDAFNRHRIESIARQRRTYAVLRGDGIRRHDVQWWSESFLNRLAAISDQPAAAPEPTVTH